MKHQSEDSAPSFLILHAILSLLAPVFLFFLVGCMIKDNLQPNDGPPIDVSQKDNAVKEVIGQKSLLDVKLNEWAVTEVTQSVFGGDTRVSANIQQLVSTRAPSSDPNEAGLLVIKIKRRVVQFNISGGEPIVTDTVDSYKAEVPNPNSSNNSTPKRRDGVLESELFSALQFDARNLSLDPSLRPASVRAAEDIPRCTLISKGLELPSGYRIEFHNLTIKKATEPPPQLVQTSPNCGGLSKCLLHTTFIEYDEILYDAQGTRDRQHCTFKLSDDAPYLATILKRCYDYLADSGKNKVPVHVCFDVINLATGT